MTESPAPTSWTLPMVEVCINTFDLAGLPETGAVFDRLLALRPGRVVVDLSRCRHIDAAAIGLLLDVHRRLVRADGALTIRNPNPRIRRILHTARLEQVLSIVIDAEDGQPEPAPPSPIAQGRAPVTTRH
ncbi:STAS domain-containing protein [Micromonospora profundi]|uniref:STAS domain-containing protein n=1 Tax=Micromonospora profundi TaxID=1420889 RepID=UPI00364F06F9